MRALVALVLVPLACLAQAQKTWTLELEGGNAWNSRNDVARPQPGGTRWRFGDLAGKGGFSFGRLQASFEGENGPGYRFLVAPLSITRSGQFASPVTYDGGTFAANADTQGTYRFDSYRATYRNRWFKSDRRDWRVGFTLKLRDAEIALRQTSVSRSFSNLGLVPLLHVYGEEKPGGPWVFDFEFDGAWSPMGYAFDGAVRARYRVSSSTELFASLRALDGGADNERVYSFATFTYASLGIRVALP